MSRRSNQPRATLAQVQARFSTARRPADTSSAEGLEWQRQRAEDAHRLYLSELGESLTSNARALLDRLDSYAEAMGQSSTPRARQVTNALRVIAEDLERYGEQAQAYGDTLSPANYD